MLGARSGVEVLSCLGSDLAYQSITAGLNVRMQADTLAYDKGSNLLNLDEL